MLLLRQSGYNPGAVHSTPEFYVGWATSWVGPVIIACPISGEMRAPVSLQQYIREVVGWKAPVLLRLDVRAALGDRSELGGRIWRRAKAWLLMLLVGAGRFECPTPCAQGRRITSKGSIVYA